MFDSFTSDCDRREGLLYNDLRLTGRAIDSWVTLSEAHVRNVKMLAERHEDRSDLCAANRKQMSDRLKCMTGINSDNI